MHKSKESSKLWNNYKQNSNRHRLLASNKEETEQVNGKVKRAIKEKLKENEVECSSHVKSIKGAVLDVLVHVCEERLQR